MIRGAVPFAILALLIALLTWLLVKGMTADTPAYTRGVAALDTLAAADALLDHDVLSARVGLLRDDDPIVREVVRMRSAIAELQAVASFPALDTLASAVARKEILTERFKTDNALLQNSVNFFDLLSTTLEASPSTAPIAPSIALLASAILHLALETSQDAKQTVQRQLDDVIRLGAGLPDQVAMHRLVAHGRMLHIMLPEVNDTLRQLLAAGGERDQAAVRNVFDGWHRNAVRDARQYWVGLYATALLLLSLLIHSAVHLRAGRIALQRRAALEQAIAQVSTRLLNCGPEDIHRLIEQGLCDLAVCLGMDRAYVVVDGAAEGTQAVYCWAAPDSGFPPSWPSGVLPAMQGVAWDTSRTMCIPRARRLRRGPLKLALTAGRVRGWAGAEVMAGAAGIGILGFDAVRPTAIWPHRELEPLQLAADAFAGVLGRQSLELRRTMLEAHIQQARQMEAVGALASGIAHNFNNIIGAITGHTEMAAAQLDGRGRAAGHLAEIGRAAAQARDLVAHILAFGKRRSNQRRPVMARALLAETVSLLRASQVGAAAAYPAPAGNDRSDPLPTGTLQLVAGVGSDHAILTGDFAQLQQVIFNLCANAAQAMDGMGDVHLRMEVELAEPRRVLHGALRRGCYLRISVTDTGRGMDKVTLGRVFEPFFTTRAQGTGLGLATVLEIVREHQGAIDVHSAPGAGSRFDVWLPCELNPSHAHREPSAASCASSMTVLLVDADHDERERGEDILAALSFEPIGFADGLEALDACRRDPERFDAVIIDYDLADALGRGFVAAMCAAVPDRQVLIAMQSPGEYASDAMIIEGISEIIIKPYAAAELAEVLARCLAKEPVTGRRVQLVD